MAITKAILELFNDMKTNKKNGELLEDTLSFSGGVLVV